MKLSLITYANSSKDRSGRLTTNPFGVCLKASERYFPASPLMSSTDFRFCKSILSEDSELRINSFSSFSHPSKIA